MPTGHNKQGGFAVVELALILVVIGFISFTSWYVWHAKKNADKNLTAVSSITPAFKNRAAANPASSIKTTPAESATFKIPELGIKITNVPASVTDLNYAIDPDGAQPGFKIAEISTVSLSKLDSNCSPTGHVSADATLSSNRGIYDSEFGPHGNVQFIKQFNGFWISYSHPESACSSNSSTEGVNLSQVRTFQALATNPKNLQTL